MKKILVAVLVLAGIAGTWYLLRPRGAAEPAEPGEKPVANVETVPLARKTIVRTLQAFGVVTVAPSGERETPAPFDCIVRKVHVAPGAPVAVGDILLEIDPTPDAKTAFESARGVLELARQALASAQQRYDLKLATSQDLLAARQAEADARLKFSGWEARGLGGDGLVKATVAGVVGKIDVAGGAFAAAGAELVSISAGSSLEARVGIEAGDMSAVAAGRRAVLRSANRPGGPAADSQVRAMGGSVDATTGEAEARVPVPPGSALVPGEHVVVTIELEAKPDALVAPRGAVLPEDGHEVLFVVAGGRAVKHDVRLGIAAGDEVEILGDGLQAGDPVVTLGNYELEDGMAVRVGPAGKTGPAAPAEEAGP